MLMGITPAPNEPPDCLLHHLLLPLAVDLPSAECDGLWIKTPRYPNGRKVNARIGTICCDRPASVAVTGCAHFRRNDSPCLKCLVRVGQLHSTRKHPAHSGVEHSEAMLAQHCEPLRQFEQAPQTARQTHVARRAGHLTKAAQAHIETLEKSIFAVPSHLSAFDLFPDFDKILHAVWIARALPPRISTVMICNLAYIRPLQIYFYRVLNNHNAAKTLEELMFQSKGGPVSPDRVSQIFLHATTNYHRKLNYIAEDGERVVFQERQATSQKMAAVRHCDADCFVINTAAFHNIDVLLSALPRTLYQPRRILEDPWEVRFTRGEQLKETTKAKSYQRDMVSVEEGQSTGDVINGRGVRERGAKIRRGRGGRFSRH
ncbi:hypothetical protein C356_06183 [Cryptococcus neoformans c45]|nr:hypothetical protein C356_06183 [Cryptococcus neoformans var. grubii c45]